MLEFFAETQIFLGKFAENVSDNSVVMCAGGRAYVKNAIYIQKHYGNGRFRNDVYVQF